MTMNEETNKSVEEVLAEVNEKVEEIDKGQEELIERRAKLLKRLDIAHKSVGVLGFGLVVGAVIRDSLK